MARIKSKKYTGVYLNKLSNGDISYSFTYKDENGKKKWVNVGKKSAGITEKYTYNKRNEYINKVKLGEDPLEVKKLRKSKLLNEAFELYIKDRELHNKSLHNEIARYNNHIKPTFGSIPIASITPEAIQKLQKQKINSGYSYKTVNHIINLLSTIINVAIEYGLYKGNNPAKKVKRLKVDNARERFLNVDEIKLLLDTVKGNPTLYLFCNLALSTGGRLETILAIQKKDIDLDNGTIKLKDFKNNSTYTGFINNILHALLSDLLPKLKTNDYILSNNSTPLTSRQIQSPLKPILDRLFNQGLQPNDRKNRVVIHTLRHTFASHLAINGTPIYTIQKLMNHKDINMTLRYAKLAPDSGRKAVNNLYS
ncbi:tyrosine-type recombinase/integrase [Nitrosophilus kaiyonis]|uniref:tyrosine-type recombinase/integrase n=1 Tax=Nitrosophilus kaiyonis TaxID=2930200 RepID=UPI0024930097|nr:site-specific integrase [Nitrosophilus kaiyonis]